MTVTMERLNTIIQMSDVEDPNRPTRGVKTLNNSVQKVLNTRTTAAKARAMVAAGMIERWVRDAYEENE